MLFSETKSCRNGAKKYPWNKDRYGIATRSDGDFFQYRWGNPEQKCNLFLFVLVINSELKCKFFLFYGTVQNRAWTFSLFWDNQNRSVTFPYSLEKSKTEFEVFLFFRKNSEQKLKFFLFFGQIQNWCVTFSLGWKTPELKCNFFSLLWKKFRTGVQLPLLLWKNSEYNFSFSLVGGKSEQKCNIFLFFEKTENEVELFLILRKIQNKSWTFFSSLGKFRTVAWFVSLFWINSEQKSDFFLSFGKI